VGRSQVVAVYPDAFRVMQGVIGASAHLERSCGATWALGPYGTKTGIGVLTGIVEALSRPFGAAMLRDIMLGWIRSRAFRGPGGVELDYATASGSSYVLGSDREESPLAEASRAMTWRGLFLFALQTRGLDMLGSESFVDRCEVLESRHRAVLGRPLMPFLRAIFLAGVVSSG
jgi:hypothetical protein